MEILSRVLPPDHDLILSGDWHEGTILQESKGLRAMLQKIEREKQTFLAFGGDAAEAITVDDKRYSGETDKKQTPLKQYRNIEESMKPIAHKTVFFLLGNHDWAIAQRYGDYIREVLCPTLKIPYGTYSTKLSIRDKKGRQMYKLFYTHGARSISSVADDPIRREANMILQLKRKLSNKSGDCEVMAMGHTHKLLVCPPLSTLYLYNEGKHIKAAYTQSGSGQWIHPDHRWYVNTGSFLRLYTSGDDDCPVSGYAERFGYDPVEIGYGVIECRDGKIKNVRKEVV